MEDDISYIPRESLPQFSNFNYEKEQPMVPLMESDYDTENLQHALKEEGAVLARNASESELYDAVIGHNLDKLTSLSEIKKALNPCETRGITEIYRAKDEQSVYLTENQFEMRFL